MTPKKAMKTTVFEEPQVHRDHNVFSLEIMNKDALEIVEMFRSQVWKHFLNHQSNIYVNEQVVEFYSTMTLNNETNFVYASVIILEQTDIAKKYNTINIDVVLIVHSLFPLSRSGNLKRDYEGCSSPTHHTSQLSNVHGLDPSTS